MGQCGGSKQHKKALADASAQSKVDVQDGQKCPLGLCHLHVHVVRIDTGKGLESISVEAKGKARKLVPTLADSGLADFEVVEPGKYTVGLQLVPFEKERLGEPTPVTVEIAKGDTKQLRFELAPLVLLRLVLVDQAGEGIRGATWKLSAPAQEGETGEKGLVEAYIPWDFEDDCDLTVRLPAPKIAAAKTSKPRKSVPPPYPPAILPEEFADEAAAAAKPALEPRLEIIWKLSLADLIDGDDEHGARARLNNLGYDVEGEEAIARSVRAWQRLYLDQASGSGNLKDILADVKTRHDTSP